MATLTGTPGHSLKALVVAPTLWAIHFLVCYVGAAVYCAKAGPGVALEPVEDLIWIATAIALAGILANGLWAFREGRFYEDDAPGYHDDTAAERRRFLAYATILLAGLSFVATLFVAMPALFIETCW